MTIQRESIVGCCASANFHNLGGAHGHERYLNVDEFASRLLVLGFTDSNLALTNNLQDIERGYLEACGFREVATTGRIWTHFASQADMRNALEPYRVKKEKVYAEKLAAQKKAREEANAVYHAELARRKALSDSIGVEKVTVEEVKQAIRTEGRGLREWTMDRFGVLLPNHSKFWSSNTEIARAINYRLVKNATEKLINDEKLNDGKKST